MKMSNPWDDIQRLDLDTIPAGFNEVREHVCHVNILVAKMKELCELQEQNLGINLLPELYGVLAKVDAIKLKLFALEKEFEDDR